MTFRHVLFYCLVPRNRYICDSAWCALPANPREVAVPRLRRAARLWKQNGNNIIGAWRGTCTYRDVTRATCRGIRLDSRRQFSLAWETNTDNIDTHHQSHAASDRVKVYHTQRCNNTVHAPRDPDFKGTQFVPPLVVVADNTFPR